MNCANKMESNGIEFVQFYIKGQSFLYNQIRNMIGSVVAVARKNLQPEVILNSFKANKFDIPLAPGEGLMLDRVSYDKYNEIKKQKRMDVKVMDMHADEVDAFKKDII